MQPLVLCYIVVCPPNLCVCVSVSQENKATNTGLHIIGPSLSESHTYQTASPAIYDLSIIYLSYVIL